jgi:hypothetical protein
LCNVLMRVVDGKEYTSFDHSLIFPRDEAGLWLNVPDVLATRFVLFNQAVAIRRKTLEKLGGFNEQLKYLEDYDLPLRLALEGPWAFIREPLVIYREGTPGSFSQAALKDPIVLKECEVKICESLLATVAGESGRASFRSHLKRRLGMARRHLWTLNLSQPDSFRTKAIRRAVQQFDRYYLGGFRRSPWFPQPRTLPVDSAGPHSPDSRSIELIAR